MLLSTPDAFVDAGHGAVVVVGGGLVQDGVPPAEALSDGRLDSHGLLRPRFGQPDALRTGGLPARSSTVQRRTENKKSRQAAGAQQLSGFAWRSGRDSNPRPLP
jgi:hypothetical protein